MPRRLIARLQLSRREQYIAVGVVCALAALLFDTCLYQPLEREAAQLHQQITAMRTNTVAAAPAGAAPRALLAEQELLRRKLAFCTEHLDQGLPSHQYVQAVTGLCRTHALTINRIRPDERSADGDTYREFTVQLDLTGTYENLVRLLQDLKSFPVFTLVDRLQLRAGENRGIQARVTVRSFMPATHHPG